MFEPGVWQIIGVIKSRRERRAHTLEISKISEELRKFGERKRLSGAIDIRILRCGGDALRSSELLLNESEAMRATVVPIVKAAAQPDIGRQNLPVAPDQIVMLQLE
jgi:hypothetical protein